MTCGKNLKIWVGGLLFVPLLSFAESGNPIEGEADEWRYTLAFPMLWTPKVEGEIRGGESIDFEVGFVDILEDLKFGLMGEFYANRGRFGAVVRFNYLQLDEKNSSSGTLSDSRIKTDMTLAVNDFLASWQVYENTRLVTGVRHVHAKVDIDVQVNSGDLNIVDHTIKVADEDQFDFLVGINFDHWFDQHWGLMFNADVGIAGDNDRDYSLDLRGLYHINKRHNFWFGYRYLNIGTDSEQDGTTYKTDLKQHGPTVGWAFTF